MCLESLLISSAIRPSVRPSNEIHKKMKKWILLKSHCSLLYESALNVISVEIT